MKVYCLLHKEEKMTPYFVLRKVFLKEEDAKAAVQELQDTPVEWTETFDCGRYLVDGAERYIVSEEEVMGS